MARHKDPVVSLPEKNADGTLPWDTIKVAVLLDIRDELRQLNRTLGCFRLVRMAEDIHRIDRRLAQTTKLPRGRRKENS